MTAQEGREIIKEIMNKYNFYKHQWFNVHRTEEGFEDWFRREVMNK
jgi:hypothetical protein